MGTFWCPSDVLPCTMQHRARTPLIGMSSTGRRSAPGASHPRAPVQTPGTQSAAYGIPRCPAAGPPRRSAPGARQNDARRTSRLRRQCCRSPHRSRCHPHHHSGKVGPVTDIVPAALNVARAYYEAWTCHDFDRATTRTSPQTSSAKGRTTRRHRGVPGVHGAVHSVGDRLRAAGRLRR